MSQLKIKAGKRAYEIIKDGGFNYDSISAYFGPAVGPRWLVSSGFDLALINENVLGRRRIVHLIGSSAGAWRFAAWLQPAASLCYQKLLDAYINVKFTRADTPAAVLEKLTQIINAYVEDDALPFALAHKKANGEKTGGTVPFGYKVRSGKLSRNAEEQKAVSLILDLSRKGQSLRGICRELEAAGVVRKQGSLTWHPQVVADILQRELKAA